MGTLLHTKINVWQWELNPDTITHPINGAQRRLTLLIETNTQPQRQVTTGCTVTTERGTVGHVKVWVTQNVVQLASGLIYARAILEFVIFILWVRSVSKMLPSVKFAEDKMLTFLILREKC